MLSDYILVEAWLIAEYHAPEPSSGERMNRALSAVLERHRPMRIYDECDHDHQDDDDDVIDCGEFLTCEEMYEYSICSSCCVENEKYPEQAEWCHDKHDHRKNGYCPTVHDIVIALEGP